MFISVFCKSCEPMLWEPEIVQNVAADFQANPTDISCKFFEQFQVHILNVGSQLLQNTEISKQTDVLFWKI